MLEQKEKTCLHCLTLPWSSIRMNTKSCCTLSFTFLGPIRFHKYHCLKPNLNDVQTCSSTLKARAREKVEHDKPVQPFNKLNGGIWKRKDFYTTVKTTVHNDILIVNILKDWYTHTPLVSTDINTRVKDWYINFGTISKKSMM